YGRRPVADMVPDQRRVPGSASGEFAAIIGRGIYRRYHCRDRVSITAAARGIVRCSHVQLRGGARLVMIAGRYRIDRVLGRGGMGIVVQATHVQLHRLVAIKFIRPDVLGTPHIMQRFLREAQAAVRLSSEHVARVLDVDMLETEAPYMVLEYLEGA